MVTKMRPNLQCDDGRKMLGGRAEEDRVREEVGQKDPRHVKKIACRMFWHNCSQSIAADSHLKNAHIFRTKYSMREN